MCDSYEMESIDERGVPVNNPPSSPPFPRISTGWMGVGGVG